MIKQDSSFLNTSLASLGPRILVMGPSNSGKSTLAVALSKKLEIEVVHLDQLRFLPNTDWALRSDAGFKQLHDDAVVGDSWIIEGNYSALLEPRLLKATGIILLNSNSIFRIYRYLKRTLNNKSGRFGHLEGTQDSLKWGMVDWILVKSRGSAARYAKVIRASGKPSVTCHTARQVNDLYRAWELTLPNFS